MSNVYFIDLFAGAGGTSSGIHRVSIPNKIVKVIACINHDKNAIISHEMNHPDTLHFIEDIRTIDLHPIIEIVNKLREEEPDCIIAIWASLECTNFSKAKGGKERDADSRTLAEHLFRYLDVFNPDYLWIENVSEFMAWGDLDENGKPISMDKGRLYNEWVTNIKDYGYEYEHKILNSADYGVPQNRKRLFIQFSKGFPIYWPNQTHNKKGENGLEKWKPVRDLLDLNDKGKSIFEGKPRSEKTLQRIYHGLVKFVAGGEENFLVKYNSTNLKTGISIPPNINEPSPTIATQGRLAICTAQQFVSMYFSGSPKSKNKSLDNPADTITTVDHHSIVSPQFLTKYYSSGQNIESLNNPCPTITTKDRMALVSSENFIYRDFGSVTNSSIDSPSGSVMTNPKLNLVSVENRNFLLNPQWGMDCAKDLKKPSPTIIARQDKTPLYLITTEDNGFGIELLDTDSEWTIKIKVFIVLYGLADIKMRMLRIQELLEIQDFPKDYVLVGAQAEQKKYIGNAVPVGLVTALITNSYKTRYYRVWDGQRSTHFATGYNCTDIRDLVKEFQSYILLASEIEFESEEGTEEYDKEVHSFIGDWCKIKDYLQEVSLEESFEPFEEYLQ